MDGLAHRPFHFLQLSAYAVGFQNLFCFRNGVCLPIVLVFTGQDAHNCLGVDLIAVKNTIPCFKMFERIDERSTDTVIINCFIVEIIQRRIIAVMALNCVARSGTQEFPPSV